MPRTGKHSIAIAPEANACLTPEALAPHLPRIREADILLMQLETPLETVELAAQEAHAHGTMVILNPAPARDLPATIMDSVSLYTPNETEAEFYTDVAVGSYADACRAAEIMHARKLEGLLITMGKSGAYYSGPHGARLVDAFPVEPVDTTAAGDTFNGALAVGLAEDMDMDQAIRFAHAAAAISVTRAGAQTSIPTRLEVDEFLKAKH
ncbi:PfkB family carbohydrate kinase [Pseudodesulfovibrio tunisiensis]|uniref:PfkB family carbohydrate kinase n=1 Tax=Pseudodesulfovibrio tunisiensis TaxID=463192 RepID=UPI001FB37E7C|nr:PfkB family carbohydrate kinase [Pseudodesulfovibrio tunisiensis]